MSLSHFCSVLLYVSAILEALSLITFGKSLSFYIVSYIWNFTMLELLILCHNTYAYGMYVCVHLIIYTYYKTKSSAASVYSR